jgi:hypothetical protein
LPNKSITDRQPLYAETRHSQVKAEANEDPEPVFQKVEDWNGWNDEMQQGVQNGFPARPQRVKI